MPDVLCFIFFLSFLGLNFELLYVSILAMLYCSFIRNTSKNSNKIGD